MVVFRDLQENREMSTALMHLQVTDIYPGRCSLVEGGKLKTFSQQSIFDVACCPLCYTWGSKNFNSEFPPLWNSSANGPAPPHMPWVLSSTGLNGNDS